MQSKNSDSLIAILVFIIITVFGLGIYYGTSGIVQNSEYTSFSLLNTTKFNYTSLKSFFVVFDYIYLPILTSYYQFFNELIPAITALLGLYGVVLLEILKDKEILLNERHPLYRFALIIPIIFLVIDLIFLVSVSYQNINTSLSYGITQISASNITIYTSNAYLVTNTTNLTKNLTNGLTAIVNGLNSLSNLAFDFLILSIAAITAILYYYWCIKSHEKPGSPRHGQIILGFLNKF